MEDPSQHWLQSDLLGLLGAAETGVGAQRDPEPELEPELEAGPLNGSASAAGDRSPAPLEPAHASAPVDLPRFGSRPEPAVQSGCPATLLILDTETTDLSPSSGSCIEVGAILFAVAQRTVLSQVSFLLPCDSNPAEAINGIAAAATRLPQPWQQALTCFNALLEHCDAVLAHNAVFDRQWFGGDGPLPGIDKPWICSMEDMRWPAERQLRPNPSVRDLALSYGVPVWAAHRALTDCIYLAQVLERCDVLEALLQGALEPRHLFRARLSYSERHQAKQAGFRWNDPVQGAWTRRLSEQEAKALPFPVQRIESTPDPLSLPASA